MKKVLMAFAALLLFAAAAIAQERPVYDHSGSFFIAAQGGCESQLRSHTAGNVNCGNDRAFLIKVVSTMCPFIGYPRTLNAMAVVDEVTGKKE